MKDNFIYFDNINTTFLDNEVAQAMEQAMTSKLGNPSAHIHSAGIQAARLVDEARGRVAALIGVRAENVIFTSGATESNNLAVAGFLRANPSYRLGISCIEHFSIINQARRLKSAGFMVEFIGVDSSGIVDLKQLERIVAGGNTLVSIAAANPEIGTIQDVDEISRICRRHGSVFHCDATAAAAVLPIDVTRSGIDLLTLSAHNMYGPMGVGALYIRDGIGIASLFDGGNQELGIRPGTENIIGIVGMGKACEQALLNRGRESESLRELGRRLHDGLARNVKFIHFTGHPEKRLPGHVSFWVEHVEGESLLLMLNMKGVMAASGSACSSNLKGKSEEDLVASHVLTAVGVPTDICAGSITFSLSRFNSAAEVDFVIEIMPGIVEKLLAMSPSYSDYMRSKESSNG
jgi:cysteine desulfurase